MSWETFAAQFPNALVLSQDTGFERPYGQSPYEGYDTRDSPIGSFFRRQVDNRLPAMERVVALELGDEVLAYPFSSLADVRVVNDDIAGRGIAVFWAPGTASAVGEGSISDGRDVGASGVFDRTVNGQELSFAPAGVGLFVDRETGTTWNILGRAVAGPLAGERLTPVQHGNHFWFAWAVFRPDVKVVR